MTTSDYPFKTLTYKSIRWFADSQAVYERGQEYHHQKAVHKLVLEDNALYAKVHGYDTYKIEITDNNGKISWYCSCPYEGNCCKHIVATLLAFVDRKQELLTASQKSESKRQTLRSQLLKLDKKRLADFLIRSIKRQHDWKATLLQLVAKELSAQEPAADLSVLYQEQYQNYFSKACFILTEHNEYGGGPESDWDKVNVALNHVTELFKQNKLSTEMKYQFIDKMMFFYNWGNSGMEDNVMDVSFEVCTTPEDWQYLIKKLEEKPSSHKKGLIMEIYKEHLKDDDTYLDMRQQNLNSAHDYYQLLQYWEEKGNRTTAVQIAELGLKKLGRSSDLLQFLFNHYQKTNYVTALGYLKQIYQDYPSLANYKRLKQFALPQDWLDIDQWCRNVISKDSALLADIQAYNQEWEAVLKYVLRENRNAWGFSWSSGNQEPLAKQLIPHFPTQLIPFYQHRIDFNIQLKTRTGYHQAAEYAKYLKEIYTTHLKQPQEWRIWIQAIRRDYERYPALIDEFKKL